MDGEPIRTFRTLFLSDIHLGSKPAKAEFLIDFLRFHDAETIYLVGDIVDGWRLRRSWHWPQAHNDVVQKLLRKARKGTRIYYVAGNHDEFLRGFQGVHFGGIVVADRIVHEAADGRRYLVIHGDQFDTIVHNVRWLAYLGDKAYDVAIVANRAIGLFRRMFGMPYWSFSSWAKIRVKQAVNFISAFQEVVTQEARRAGVDGVVCGHIHHATIEEMGDIRYINTGDWVESCTAVAENNDGSFELITWTQVSQPTADTVSEEDALADKVVAFQGRKSVEAA
ncbi:UDP-2,3-diacylglucosamine diphosphatase [Nitratireductor mangrovi]|uniref:UDP-2,3-diacylglucosamine diphosphatase n=1 Tax=Nitratireductor mangrovi TaxID=2599600 RepID=A0A5B8L258_9HYPH|nr:UDP-2,3-diacylglucosamine diphosphatase [Nitratireductor mangrovi]QDZ01933.1 UDP-2,3-diacylglucosamine diphosphatase [Nitratireductor mangrovi]